MDEVVTVDDAVLAHRAGDACGVEMPEPGPGASRSQASVPRCAAGAPHRPALPPPHPALGRFLSCKVAGCVLRGVVWLADVIEGPPRATTAQLGLDHAPAAAARILHESAFKHMLRRPRRSSRIRAAADAGSRRIWFAGGYLHPTTHRRRRCGRPAWPWVSARRPRAGTLSLRLEPEATSIRDLRFVIEPNHKS